MKIKTKPLFLALAISIALSNAAYSAHTQEVAAGETVYDEVVDSTSSLSNTQRVYGTAVNTSIEKDAFQIVENGGVAIGSIIRGNQSVHDGGVASDSIVEKSGMLLLNSGEINNVEIYGYLQNIEGDDYNTKIKSGGLFRVLGQPDSRITRSYDATIEDGGSAYVSNNAELRNWSVDGKVYVYRAHPDDTFYFPIFNSTTVSSNGYVSLNFGAKMFNAIINGGGVSVSSEDNNMYSTVTDTTINNGNLFLYENGIASNSIQNGGSMVNFNGSDINTIVNSGVYQLGSSDTYSVGTPTSSNLQVNSEGIAYINSGTVTDARINGTMFVHPYSPNAISKLQGDVSIGKEGKLKLTAGVNTENADVTLSGSLFLDHNETVVGNSDFTLGAMRIDGGNLYFTKETDRYSSLTIDSLDGTGSFYMNTNLASLQGDFLTVTGQANGDFDVYISDTGISPTSDSSLQIIQTGGGNADFTLANNGHVVDVGTYQYYLVSDGQGGWALSPESKPETPDPEPTPEPIPEPTPEPIPEPTPEPIPPSNPTITPSTASILSMATVDPLVFQTELNPVRSRIDQIHFLSHDTNVWGYYTTNQFNVGNSAGADYGMNINGMTIGVDKSNESDNAVTTGIFFSYSRSDVDFDRGGDGNVSSYSVGTYTSYLNNSGFYLDGILKLNRFNHDVNAKMTSGTSANGYYNTTGIGANIQVGKYFYFGDINLTPYASLTGFISNPTDYGLSNGMQAEISSQRSFVAETGVSVAHKFVVKGAEIQPYVKLAVTQEFIDDNAVKVNADHFINDLSGTQGVYQLGLNAKVTDNIAMHADASYANGRNIETPLTANFGVSWSF